MSTKVGKTLLIDMTAKKLAQVTNKMAKKDPMLLSELSGAKATKANIIAKNPDMFKADGQLTKQGKIEIYEGIAEVLGVTNKKDAKKIAESMSIKEFMEIALAKKEATSNIPSIGVVVDLPAGGDRFVKLSDVEQLSSITNPYLQMAATKVKEARSMSDMFVKNVSDTVKAFRNNKVSQKTYIPYPTVAPKTKRPLTLVKKAELDAKAADLNKAVKS